MNADKIYEKAFEAFNHFKVLIVGDVMLDSYTWGKVERISPEAPVPVLACNKREDRLGGAANVAKNIKALGAEATICTVIGKDEAGDRLLSLFEKNDLTTTGILRSSERRTTVKTRFLSGYHHLLRADEEDTEYISKNLEEELYAKIKKEVNENAYQAIVFQDYDKGVLTPTSIDKLKLLAKENNLLTIVDPKRRNFASYSATSLFKPNFKEFIEGTGYEVSKNNFKQLGSYAQEYRELKQIEILLITLSELGVLICSQKGVEHIPAQVHEIADVSGAGDTVVATATLCFIAGLSPKLIAAISNMAGSLVCQHPVVVSVSKKELLNELVDKY